MDRQVVEQKLESLRRCLRRLAMKCPSDRQVLEEDIDLQDIISLNLSRAVQLCVDIGAHWLSDMDSASPDSMGQTFDILAQQGVINKDLAARLRKAVGFRNIAVHNYESINWTIVHSLVQHHLGDFTEFAKAMASKLLVTDNLNN